MERMVSTVDFQIADLSRQASEASRLLKAMSNECRLLILCFLAEAGELSVGELTARVGLSQSALSQHLARLRDEGLVATRKDAQSVFYRICDPRAEQVLGFLHQIYCPELGRESGPARDTGDFA
jgi:ArsR family transcriptional regulator, virulence genes transcriptional regulator